MRSQAVFVVLAVLVLVASSLPLDGPRTEDLLDTTQLPDTGSSQVRKVRSADRESSGNCRTELNRLHGEKSDFKQHIDVLCQKLWELRGQRLQPQIKSICSHKSRS